MWSLIELADWAQSTALLLDDITANTCLGRARYINIRLMRSWNELLEEARLSRRTTSQLFRQTYYRKWVTSHLSTSSKEMTRPPRTGVVVVAAKLIFFLSAITFAAAGEICVLLLYEYTDTKRLCVFGGLCVDMWRLVHQQSFLLVLLSFDCFWRLVHSLYTVGTVLVDLWRLVHQWSKTIKNSQKTVKTAKITVGVPIVTCLHRVRRIHKTHQNKTPINKPWNANRNSSAIYRIEWCDFQWSYVTLSDSDKYSLTRSIARLLCDNWACTRLITDTCQGLHGRGLERKTSAHCNKI